MRGSKRETTLREPSSGNSLGKMRTKSCGEIMFRNLCVCALVTPKTSLQKSSARMLAQATNKIQHYTCVIMRDVTSTENSH
jgi:hypothetical protein